ncbi:unnamed protein product [Candida parapsilosis]
MSSPFKPLPITDG